MMKRLLILLIVGLLVIFSTLAVTQHRQSYFPVIEIELADPSSSPSSTLTFNFLFHSLPTLHKCEALVGNITRVMLKGCTQCRIKRLECGYSLDQAQRIMLSNAELPVPSGQMGNGVVTFHSETPGAALAICQAAETQSAFGNNPIKCFDANTPRVQPATSPVQSPWTLLMILSAFSAAWLTGWFIVKYEHLHAHYSHDLTGTGPQKYHAHPTPRIGGLAVMAGLLGGGAILFVTPLPSEYEYGLLLVACTPAFLGGLVEDVTKKVGVLERLLLTMLSGAVAAWLLGITLQRLDMGGVYSNLVSIAPAIAVVFTMFAVGGIANAINIIDGYNGLSGGFAVIVLSAMAYVAYVTGDSLVFSTSLALAGALLGFLAWNWPSGKIFLGDGGAYLTGFILAELSVLLVARNPSVSAWFPMLLLIYPVFETFYSIYRRKLKNGLSPGQPDNMHLHQLIHDNIVPRHTHRGIRLSRLDANNRVAKYLWIQAIMTSVLGCLFWQSTNMLIGLTIAYCVVYVACYRMISREEAPENSQKHKTA